MTTPDPWAIDGAVVLDMTERTATVVPAEPGYAGMLWRNGVEKMTREVTVMTPATDIAPIVWAHSPSRREVARGEPQSGALTFRFRPGDLAWSELVGTPALSATVVLDRARKQIISVKFRGRTG